mgnify:CR=1 FL=1
MYTYIIREVNCPDFSFFFDDDGMNKSSGDYNNTIFTLTYKGSYYSTELTSYINNSDFDDIYKEMQTVLTEIDDIENGYSYYKNIKEVMTDYNIKYTSKAAHTLKELSKECSFNDPKTLSAYLTIKTCKPWTTKSCSGYCQGDYVTILYCKDNYNDEYINIIGDMFLGCGKEFGVITIDENGEEIDSCYGFYVADSQGYRPEDYKRIVSADYGMNEDDKITLELISGYSTITNYETY